MGPTWLLFAGCFFSPQGSVDATEGATTSASDTGLASEGTGPLASSGGVTLDPSGEPTTGATDTSATTGSGDAVCGDAKVDPGEECDNGELNNGQNGSICKVDCSKNVCGDGYLAANEGCDDGNQVDDDDCSNTCKAAGCGDGKLDPGEECDAGDANGGADCSALCKLPACGDGEINAGEECDDGLGNGKRSACTPMCKVAVCGDGLLLAGVEACDDGNAAPEDGCFNCVKDCGNGQLNLGEQCDDGNLVDDDGCDGFCKLSAFIVFASSQQYTGNLGGLAGADAKCNALAAEAKLPGSYKAWLSVKDSSASQRLFHSDKPYIRTDGVEIASDWKGLVSGGLLAPLNHDEKNMVVGFGANTCDKSDSLVWTATDALGNAQDSTCNAWLTQSQMSNGGAGNLNALDSGWSIGCSLACSVKARLYCFQQP